MDELEKNLPDDFWRKAFDEAAETPPPRVWDAIERQLDESNNPKILPLWGIGRLASQPVKWGVGIAAAIALLLVGWWAIHMPLARPQLTHNQPANPSSRAKSDQVDDTDNQRTLSTNKPNQHPSESSGESIASVNGPLPNSNSSQNTRYKGGKLATEPGLSTHPTSQFIPENQVAQTAKASRNLSRFENRLSINEIAGKAASGMQVSTESPRQRSRVMSVGFTSLTSVADINNADLVSLHTVQIHKLSSRPMKLRSPSGIHRIVWYRPAELTAEPERSKSKHEHREVWASVSMMPGAFNPSVGIRSLQTAALNVAASSQPAVASKPDFSIAYQAGAGIQLSERWSVESGIGYLSGHSTVESPSLSNASASFAPTNKSATAGNLYANAVRNSIQGEALNAAASSNYDKLGSNTAYYAAYSNQNQQSLANNFEYVQVPVQLGYQLRPRKRLSMALLGGFLTNIFVRNTVGDDLVITGKDGVYRPLSLAASMGARFRYRPSQRWSASLAGMYQPSLGFGTRPESQVRTSPTSAGMSFGLDYHF